MSNAWSVIFPKEITRDQAKDTGMALVLACLVLRLFLEKGPYIEIAAVMLVANMITPMAFKYPAFIWLGFSRLLGTAVSKILLTLIFFLIVTPVSVLRRIFGFDSLQLRRFKKDTESVMISRNITYSGKDLTVPY